jgi:hypothetical protein
VQGRNAQETAMNAKQELSLCHAIESRLSDSYGFAPGLTDRLCVLALDNSITALKQHFGFAKNETVLTRPDIDDIVVQVVAIGVNSIDRMPGVTLKDYIAVINKIRKSVIRHSAFGPRAYYDFIQDYV